MTTAAAGHDFASTEQWQYATLGQIAQIKGGKRLPKGEKFADTVTSFPYLRVTDFENFSVNTSDLRYLTPEIRASIARYTISKNDVYISIAGSIGVTGMIPARLDGANLTENAAKLIVDEIVIDPRFLMYYLASETAQSEIRGHTVKNAQPKLALARIATLGIPLPPLLEQRKIAAVLGLVQRAIEQQERLIALTTELKKALLDKLFTEGLRGEPQKQTEIGAVPESWKKINIGDLGLVVTGATPKTKVAEYYIPGEIDFIAPADLGAARSVYNSARLISRRGLATVRAVPARAVMCVCIGSSIGKVGMTTKDVSATNQQINSIVCNEGHEPAFVYYLLSYFSEYWRGFANFGPLPILSKGSFEAISIFVPGTIEEEAGISRCLSAVDAKTELHVHRRDLLCALFRTTLHQLMTARIRVHDLGLSQSDCAT
jgi:type I restriction enzyme, S subunit